MTRTEEKRIFAEACNGFGFEPVERYEPEVYCTGCMTTHDRRTKMYTNGERGHSLGACLCRYQVVRLFNPEDQ